MRVCGGCSVCCYIGGVPELDKPAHTECIHIDDIGCGIHGEPGRPDLCRKFQCLWLKGFGFDEDRPDVNKIFCTSNDLNGGCWPFIMETEENSAMTTGRSMVERIAILSSTPVIIVDFFSKPPNDFGDRVVIKDELKFRSKRMRGDFIEYLSPEIGVYSLVVG